MPRDRQNAATLRDEIIFTVLDEVSRHRPLAIPESELMELAMHRLGFSAAEQSPAEQQRRRMHLLAKRNALHQRDAALVDLLSKLQSFRALSRHESWLLAGAMHRLGLTHDKWHWTPEEDEMITRLLRNRARRRPKLPYTRNDEVERLAVQLGRSYWAVQRRIERLRKSQAEKMFKRANGHASLDSEHGRNSCTYKTSVDGSGRAAGTAPAEAARPEALETNRGTARSG